MKMNPPLQRKLSVGLASGPVLFWTLCCGPWSPESATHWDSAGAARCLGRKVAGGEQKQSRSLRARVTLSRLHELPGETGA